MGGTSLVEGTFEIAGRGLVITGQILEGTLCVGDRIALPTDRGETRVERISGVEMGHRRGGDGTIQGFVGLVVGELAEKQIIEIRKRVEGGKTLVVEDPLPR